MTFERSGLEKYDSSMENVKSNPKTWILQKNQLRARAFHFRKITENAIKRYLFCFKKVVGIRIGIAVLQKNHKNSVNL